MNTKSIFKSGALMLAMTIILTVVSFAQTTYYVNVQTGLDGNTGLVAIGTAPQGPKATINNAIAAASAGDIIVIDYGNGNIYNEDVVVTKKLTFNVSANSGTGTPIVRSWVVNNATAGTGNNQVIFSGALSIVNSLTLQDGAVIGASNLTIGGTPMAPVTSPFIKRFATGANTSGTVDSQLKYNGAVDFVYDVTAGPVTTGLELAPTANTTAIKSLTTIGANKLTLNESKTDAGVLVTAGALDLGGYTLTVKGAANTIGGDVTNGTLAFSMGAATGITGAFKLPNVTASGAQTLTLTGITQVGNLSASSGASVGTNNLVAAFGDITNSGSGAVNTGTGVAFTVGKVTNTSTGTIVIGATATTINDVANSGAGTITLDGGTTSIASISNSSNGIVNSTLVGAVLVTGNVTNNGTSTASTKGQINFSSTAGVTVNGTVTNAPTVTSANASVTNAGLITFADGPHVLKGVVTNQPVFGGAIGATATVSIQDNGQIRFATTTGNLTLKSGLVVAASNTMTDAWTSGATTITVTGNGTVKFALTTGNYLSDLGISNSSNFPDIAKAGGRAAVPTVTDNAQVLFTGRTTGTIGVVATPIGAISNTSTAVFMAGVNGNGLIYFGATGGGVYAGAVSTSGADGGAIIFGNESVTLASITNSRTVAQEHIQVGASPLAGVSVAISGDVNNSGASTINFKSYNGAAAETFGIGGTLTNSGTGTVKIDAAAVLTGAAAISLGGINLSNGTIDFKGAGAATKAVVVNGPASFTAGTLNMATTAARQLQLGGLANTFSTATTRPDFSTTGMVNVTLFVRATTPAGAQTLTGAPTATVWYGPVVIDNNNAGSADPGVVITGGNFRVLNDVTFASTKVRIDNVTLFIGGQNAPFAGVGNFTNTSGYTVTGNGFVSMNGNGAAQTVSGAGVFGNFEVDAPAGAAVAGVFKSQFNLTNGAVTG
ncbi:MAG TPA: hypothetical protein VK470_15425, partial [Bacteroidota bacterium]|nr:hypothetical protein [Bacteroidota bacterium]